jgi:hypothetical protein
MVVAAACAEMKNAAVREPPARIAGVTAERTMVLSR